MPPAGASRPTSHHTGADVGRGFAHKSDPQPAFPGKVDPINGSTNEAGIHHRPPHLSLVFTLTAPFIDAEWRAELHR